MSDAVEKSFRNDATFKRDADGTIISISWPMDCVYSDHIARQTHSGKYARVQNANDAGGNVDGDSSSSLAS